MLAAIALVAAITADAPPSHKSLVGFMDGAGRRYHREAADHSDERDVCLGYLAGSVDQILAILDLKSGSRPFCPTGSLNLEDVRSVLSLVKAKSTAARTAGAHVVVLALQAACPCSANGRATP